MPENSPNSHSLSPMSGPLRSGPLRQLVRHREVALADLEQRGLVHLRALHPSGDGSGPTVSSIEGVIANFTRGTNSMMFSTRST